MMTARNNATVVYAVLLAISFVWIGLVLAAPWLMAEQHYSTSVFIYRGLSAACHQISDRSFHTFGFPLGVCSRCTGVYAGFTAGLIAYPFLRDLTEEGYPPRRILIAASLPAAVDFTLGFLGVFENTFLSRTSTGILFGSTAAFFIVPGLVSAVNDLRSSFATPGRIAEAVRRND
jgi:uncharacterized membrane protein